MLRKSVTTFLVTAISCTVLAGVSVASPDLEIELKNEVELQNEVLQPSVSLASKLSGLEFSSDITQEQINSLNPAMIHELASEEGEILSIKTTESVLNTIPGQDASIMQMPKSDFELTVVAQRIPAPAGYPSNGDYFRFLATGDWKIDPFYNFTDAIALSWSDNFTLYEDRAYVTYGPGDDLTQYETWTSRSTVDAEQGVGYNIDMLYDYIEKYVVLVARVYKHPNETGSANVVAEYGHVQLTGRDVTIGFESGNGGSSVSMSVGFGATLNKAIPAYDDFIY